MSMYAIHGHALDVTVIGCTKLKDTEWISRQDPYVCLEYGSTKFRTRTCTDGGKNPVFQEKFIFSLIEGLRELSVFVWNSNTITLDDFIGSGKIQLDAVLSKGYDDSSWPIQTKTGRYAGEVRVILHYANANKPVAASSAPAPHVPFCCSSPYPTHSSYYSYPANTGAFPPYPPPPVNAYPQGQPPPSTVYPPPPPPPPSTYYPPPPYNNAPGSYFGTYPPPPY